MSEEPSTQQEPESQPQPEASNNIPDPSPAKEWEKEKDSTAGTSLTHTAPDCTYEDAGVLGSPTREETTWAAISHLSVLLNLVTGFLGGIVAIVIYFIYKDRSRFVAYHAMQSFVFQAITWLGGGLISGLLIAFGGAFSFLILPLLCLIPGFLILLLVPISLIYGVIGAVQVSNNGNFSYWIIGDWVLGKMASKRP
jgi:uncharacterized Tic20 family protein